MNLYCIAAILYDVGAMFGSLFRGESIAMTLGHVNENENGCGKYKK